MLCVCVEGGCVCGDGVGCGGVCGRWGGCMCVSVSRMTGGEGSGVAVETSQSNGH